MAELTIFAYRHRDTGLQALDARLKLASLAALSIAALHCEPRGMISGSLMACMVVWKSGIALRHMVHEFRYFACFVICVGLVRAWSATAEPAVQVASLSISRSGMISGAILSWRLLLIAILGLGLTASTPPGRIRAAIEWFLRPLPGIPHQALGTMIGLLVRFIPVILGQSRAILDAQRARAVDHRKNPVYRIKRFSMPLLQRSIITADRLACAMEARSYNARRTSRTFKASSKDLWTLVGVGAACALMVWS